MCMECSQRDDRDLQGAYGMHSPPPPPPGGGQHLHMFSSPHLEEEDLSRAVSSLNLTGSVTIWTLSQQRADLH